MKPNKWMLIAIAIIGSSGTGIAQGEERVDIDTSIGLFKVDYSSAGFPTFTVTEDVSNRCLHVVGHGPATSFQLIDGMVYIDGVKQGPSRLLDATIINGQHSAYDISLDGFFAEVKNCPGSFISSFE